VSVCNRVGLFKRSIAAEDGPADHPRKSMRKATYKIEVKARCRRRLVHFIQEHFDRRERSTLQVLCLPGPEALEIFDVYDKVGVPRSNVVCLEKDAEALSALKKLRLGCEVSGESLSEFIDRPQERRFHVISLDFTGQLATYEGDVRRMVERGLLEEKAIVFTNFCAAREADASKGFYLARTVSEGLGIRGFHKMVAASLALGDDAHAEQTRELVASVRDHLETLPSFGNATELRDDAIHLEIRNALRASDEKPLVAWLSPDVAQSLKEETASVWASLDERIDSLPECEERAGLVQLRAHNRRKSDSIPTPVVWRRNQILTGIFEDVVDEILADETEWECDQRWVAKVLQRSCVFAVGPPWVSFDAASFRYVSDNGIPMNADIFALRHIRDFSFLRPYLDLKAETVEEVLAPLAAVDFQTLRRLVDECILASRRLVVLDEAPSPKRMFLGAESKVNPMPARALSVGERRERALQLMAESPAATSHEIAARVGSSPEQVAAWKAHRTMGTYGRK
jgi:hypothetical protein